MMRDGRAMMDSTGVGRVSVPDDLRALYAPAAELESVERLLQGELSSHNPFVDRLGQHGFRLGGSGFGPPWFSCRPKPAAESGPNT